MPPAGVRMGPPPRSVAPVVVPEIRMFPLVSTATWSTPSPDAPPIVSARLASACRSSFATTHRPPFAREVPSESDVAVERAAEVDHIRRIDDERSEQAERCRHSDRLAFAVTFIAAAYQTRVASGSNERRLRSAPRFAEICECRRLRTHVPPSEPHLPSPQSREDRPGRASASAAYRRFRLARSGRHLRNARAEERQAHVTSAASPARRQRRLFVVHAGRGS